jgi:GNAT superfamily N-acetyltransferase
MSHTLSFGPLNAADQDAVARLLHRSLADWYESRLRLGARYGDNYSPFLLFPQVYEALDPGEAVTARDSQSGELIGVCFSHERETHVSVGIVATAPKAWGRGVARQMMEQVLGKAARLRKPVRLVSSLLNLDSFSLYTRIGFAPGAIFQDMLMSVPDTGMTGPVPLGVDRVREAQTGEAARIAGFESSMQGIHREKDFAFFLRNEVGSWRVLVSEQHGSGQLNGFLAMSVHPSFRMIGPGVAADEETAASLLWRALDGFRGRPILFLVPCNATGLVQTAYHWGARNVEMHVVQSTGGHPPAKGIPFPSFLPESA